jgi:hypothetical protein
MCSQFVCEQNSSSLHSRNCLLFRVLMSNTSAGVSQVRRSPLTSNTASTIRYLRTVVGWRNNMFAPWRDGEQLREPFSLAVRTIDCELLPASRPAARILLRTTRALCRRTVSVLSRWFRFPQEASASLLWKSLS